MTITGKAPDQLVFGGFEPKMSHVGPGSISSTFETVRLRTKAREILISFGWKPKVASDAVDHAMATLGPDAPIDKIIFEASRALR